MARRGENIHKRKDGRWEGRYIKARTPDRRICWGYIYGTTYAEVKQRLIHKKSEYHREWLKAWRVDLLSEGRLPERAAEYGADPPFGADRHELG